MQDAYFLSVGNESYLVVGTLTQYCDNINESEAIPEGAALELKTNRQVLQANFNL